MLVVSLAAALLSLVITPPSASLLKTIDWKTLATLFMLLSVLDGFKNENLFYSSSAPFFNALWKPNPHPELMNNGF